MKTAWFLLLGLCIEAFAQVERGTIVGTVRDATGAVVVGADVVVRNSATNVPFATKSDNAGVYTAPSLIPGSYEVSITMQGFRSESLKGLLVETGQRARADFVLEPGQANEHVEVRAEAPLMQSESSALGTVIAQQKINDLPLNGRSFISLLPLSSGLTAGTPGRLLSGRGVQVVRGGSAFSANGMRDTANNFLIDGIDNNEMSVNTIAYFPSIDAIQEFKVQTSVSDAEFGRNAGSTVNLSIKSGTNELHGTAYEFLRNQVLDAKNFFDPPGPTPALKHNQFGFSLGGPVRHDKTFFFVDYEGKRYIDAQTFTNTVGTDAQRAGNFSGFATIYDPATYNSATNSRTPFPNNTIPANRLNSASKFIAALLPQPNLGTKINNFVYNPNKTANGDQFDTKIDHYFSSSDSMFLRYSYAAFSQFQPEDLPGEAGGSAFRFGGYNDSPTHQIAFMETHLFSPTLLNTVRLGFTRFSINATPADTGSTVSAKAGIPGVNVSNVSSGLMGITIDGYSPMGDSSFVPSLLFQNAFTLQDSITWVRSSHSIKFGVDGTRRYLNFFAVGSPRGTMNFPVSYTTQPSAPTGTGDGFATFLLGIPSTGSVSRLSGPYGQQYTEFGTYIKDDWKLRPNLTLNLGLRYEVNTPLVEKYNRMTNFNFATGQLIVAGTPGYPRGLVNTDWNNINPRIGVAWNPTRRVTVHGGFGMFSNIEASAGGKRLTENAPFNFAPSFNQSLVQPARTITDGFPPNAVVNLQSPAGVNVISWDQNMPNGYAEQFNLSIETELVKNLVLRTQYVGTHGVHLFAVSNENQALPGPGTVASRQPYPLLGTFTSLKPRGNSIYHSFQLQLERRLSHGLSFLTAFTFSKAIDNNSGVFNDNDSGGGASTQNRLAYNAERALSDFNIGKRLVTSFNWELPFGRGHAVGTNWNGLMDGILGGWQINGIVTFQTGLPFTPTGPDQTNGAGGTRPNRIGDGTLASDQRTMQRWFDKTAFAIPAQFTFGNSGRNILLLPGLKNGDLSLFKNFKITERYNLQLRGEAFNLTNTPYFGPPNTRIDLAAGGNISIAYSHRIMQVGAKLRF